MFYDIRAGKYLESSINSSRTVVLKASKGYVVSIVNRDFLFSFVNLLLFGFSFLRRLTMDFNKLSTSQQFIPTATTSQERGCLQLEDHFLLT